MKRLNPAYSVTGLALVLAMSALGCQDDNSPARAALAPDGGGQTVSDGFRRMPLLSRLDSKLDLTPAQHDAIEAILKRERASRVESRKERQHSEADRAAREAHRKQVGDEIALLLTDQQKAIFTEMRAKLHEHRQGGFGHGEFLTRELNLSAAQQEQLRGLIEEKQTAMKALRAENPDGRSNRSELRPRFQAIREKFRSGLEAILTPEQKTMFEQLIAERKPKSGK